MTTPGSPCMVCGKPMVADNRRVPPDVDCCRCDRPTDDPLPTRTLFMSRMAEAADALRRTYPVPVKGKEYADRVDEAAARLRELEADNARLLDLTKHDALVVISMDAELAEAHADILRLTALGNALADAARVYVHESRRTRAFAAALAAWENR